MFDKDAVLDTIPTLNFIITKLIHLTKEYYPSYHIGSYKMKCLVATQRMKQKLRTIKLCKYGTSNMQIKNTKLDLLYKCGNRIYQIKSRNEPTWNKFTTGNALRKPLSANTTFYAKPHSAYILILP